MKRKRIALDMFEEFVLPQLQQKHPKIEDLRKAIADEYDIFETVDEDGETKEVSVKYSVSQPEAPKIIEKKPEQTDINKMVDEALKAKAPTKPVDIRVQAAAVPEGLKLYRKVQNFNGTEEEKKRKAYQWGCFVLGGVMGMQKYADKLKDMGILITKAQSEGTNTAGGVLVPSELDNYIVDLKESYGVFRRNARVSPMVRDVQEFPRRTGGLTASFIAEAGALSESSKSWDSITLTTKKLTALAKMSVELMEDAIINVGDDLAGEIAYAFSKKEDECGFIGDASSTYGGILGASPAIKAMVGATTTSAGGVIVATGNLMSEVVIGDLLAVMGNLPQYADMNAKWYCHKFFWWNVLERLERAAGGVLLSEQRSGAVKTAFGYPVEITQTLPSTDANSQILCLFGSLPMAATFGDRRQTTISISDQVYWANDQVGIKGTERFDIVVHDIGTSTVAGPLVALQSLNS